VFQPGFVGAASLPARLLCDAAVRGDPSSLARASRGLAGLGPGLTPSGDDFLAGFAAAWTLVGASLGLDGAACRRVTVALLAGAARGARRSVMQPRHACRGELLEPMTRFVGALLAEGPHDVKSMSGALLRSDRRPGQTDGGLSSSQGNRIRRRAGMVTRGRVRPTFRRFGGTAQITERVRGSWYRGGRLVMATDLNRRLPTRPTPSR
jgi:hypothetical protein